MRRPVIQTEVDDAKEAEKVKEAEAALAASTETTSHETSEKEPAILSSKAEADEVYSRRVSNGPLPEGEGGERRRRRKTTEKFTFGGGSAVE